jgi:hypothetical protein
MLAALLHLGVLALQDARAKKPAPAPEEVAKIEAALDEAFRSREVQRMQSALEAAQAVPHPAVVRKVARGLADERPEVRLAALRTLRWLDHRDALEALHRVAKDRRLMKAPEQALAVLRGIGQHADPSSIPILAQDPFQLEDAWCLRARIFGLARIRTLDALEALLGILAVTNAGSSQRRIQPRMDDMRLALSIVTGVDQGRSPELWENWWRENRRTFRIPADVPPLPKELRRDWDSFWGLPLVYARDGLREDRGLDEPPRKE